MPPRTARPRQRQVTPERELTMARTLGFVLALTAEDLEPLRPVYEANRRHFQSGGRLHELAREAVAYFEKGSAPAPDYGAPITDAHLPGTRAYRARLFAGREAT